MEHGTLEREIHIEATPEVVFSVISDPAHVQEWWPDEADFDATPGGNGRLTWNDPEGPKVVSLTVVAAEPGRLFSFRWTHPAGEAAAPGNSLLVTFELSPTATGTLLRMTETGFREMGWEVAALEETYRDHVTGWEHYLPRLTEYAARLAAAR
ncbi:Activator of Hsp90 ATPase 1 family protein [metagenome]|uniref:Activator of Hsp90 ATPase 1 family protein n=1 Tax=metagenome TaxID=256318 RepID=A0A2P2C9P9_9ZZZZ